MKYFGTDGIRGVVDLDLDKKIIKKIAVGIVNYYKLNNFERKIIIGNDGRNSSDYIFSILAETLTKFDIAIYNINTCSSPCLAYTTKEFNFPLGVMITASHNPKEYNGIKFFNSFGEKISEDNEIAFELCMDKKITTPIKYSKIVESEKFKHKYIEYLKKLKSFNFNCIFDCSNGGSSQICRQVFPKYQIINANHHINKINENCGCTHPEFLMSQCKQKGLIGFAFDGDADRVLIVTPQGEILDGDDLLSIFSKFFLKRGEKVVGSPYTNSALVRQLKLNGIDLIRANVGDKNIYKTMLETNSILGGEESGHVIVKPFTNTGDGLLNAILICNILSLTKLDISNLSGLKKDFQSKVNIKLNTPFETSKEIEEKIKFYNNLNVRIILRKSGTEPIVRLFAESENKDACKSAIEEIKNLIN